MVFRFDNYVRWRVMKHTRYVYICTISWRLCTKRTTNKHINHSPIWRTITNIYIFLFFDDLRSSGGEESRVRVSLRQCNNIVQRSTETKRLANIIIRKLTIVYGRFRRVFRRTTTKRVVVTYCSLFCYR